LPHQPSKGSHKATKERETDREGKREGGEASFAPLSFNDQTPRVE